MGLKQFSMVFAVVFLLVGVLGFVPGVTTEGGLLLGIFKVSPLHNAIHLVSGLAALIGAASDAYAKVYFQVFGVVYALVAVVGFVQGDTLLGLVPVNMADNLLHTVIALVALGLGFGKSAGEAPAQQSA